MFPQEGAIFWVHRNQPRLRKEDHLTLSKNRCGNRRRMRHFFVVRLPRDFASRFVQGEKRLPGSTSRDENQVSVDQRRGSIRPGDVTAGVLLHQVSSPDLLAVLRVVA